jgi:GWxTD domain-containing protein
VSKLVSLLWSYLAAASALTQDLSKEHELWLEEEVVYIISEREREIFLLLETHEERDRFIEAFWRTRDPNPTTPQNEYRDEHRARLDHANRYFGRDSASPGWKTDRGRIYIKLGKPQDIERFPATRDLVPTELWFFSGDNPGLPGHFHLIFFKPRGYGEYRLYHPLADGPGSLLANASVVASSDPQSAMEVIRRASIDLSRAALSIDAGEAADYANARALPSTEILLANIESSPLRSVSAEYADSWLSFRDRVSLEYSFNFVPHRSFFAVLAARDGTPFVSYTVEIDAKHFSLEANEDQTKFHTTLDITTELRTEHGDLILSKDKSTYLEMTRSQLEQVIGLPFAYQDSFPVVPGDYSISVIVKNRVQRRFTIAEFELNVEEFSSGNPALTDVIPGFSTELIEEPAANQNPGTFQTGNVRIQPASGAVFAIGEPVYSFFQVIGGSMEDELRFTLTGEGRTVVRRSTKVGAYGGGPVIERFDLENVVGGRYELRVQLVDPEGAIVAEKATDLNVTPRTGLARPGYVAAFSFNTAVPGLVNQALGEQLYNLGRYDDARRVLKEAVAVNSQLLSARWLLADVHNRLNEPALALAILEPMMIDHSDRYEVLFGLGHAKYLKNDFVAAVGYLEGALAVRPPTTIHLNLLSDCYEKLGNLEKARQMLERSLELVPDQPEIQQQLQRLRP